METIKLGKSGDQLFISDDVYSYRYAIPDRSDFVTDALANLLKNSVHIATQYPIGIGKRALFEKMVEAYSCNTGLKSRAFLDAHGGRSHNTGYEWFIKDGGRRLVTQDWIDSIDGKFAAIELMGCNPSGCEITSKRSIIIHPNAETRLLYFILGYGYRIYVPDMGYIENNKNAITKLLHNRAS